MVGKLRQYNSAVYKHRKGYRVKQRYIRKRPVENFKCLCSVAFQAATEFIAHKNNITFSQVRFVKCGDYLGSWHRHTSEKDTPTSMEKGRMFCRALSSVLTHLILVFFFSVEDPPKSSYTTISYHSACYLSIDTQATLKFFSDMEYVTLKFLHRLVKVTRHNHNNDEERAGTHTCNWTEVHRCSLTAGTSSLFLWGYEGKFQLLALPSIPGSSASFLFAN